MFRYATAIGADIGRLSLKTAVIKMNGELLLEDSVGLRKKQDREYIITELAGAIARIRQSAAALMLNPVAVGISAKGFVDHENGILLGPDQGIRNWKNVPLSRIIGRETGLPVFAGNDANLMTLAEQQYGAARGFSNVVFVALRTGIGGGIIVNGKLYRGVNNAGGEIGQMIINFSGEKSEKGIRGSLEYFASAAALVRRFLVEKSLRENESGGITAREIFRLSYARDPAAMKAVRENAELVGVGLANLITIFAPEIIVLGGGMAEARSSYLEMIRKSAFRNSLENCRASVRIERAALGSRAALFGAVYYSLTRLAGKTI